MRYGNSNFQFSGKEYFFEATFLVLFQFSLVMGQLELTKHQRLNPERTLRSFSLNILQEPKQVPSEYILGLKERQNLESLMVFIILYKDCWLSICDFLFYF